MGVTYHSLYQWIKRYRMPPAEREVAQDQQTEMRGLDMKSSTSRGAPVSRISGAIQSPNCLWQFTSVLFYLKVFDIAKKLAV